MYIYNIKDSRLFDRNGKPLGYIEEGCVKNSLGRALGYIDGDAILDSNRKLIATIENNKMIFPNNGSPGDLDEASKLIDSSQSNNMTLAAYWLLLFVD